jgi:ABC-type transport system involved in multi-copper enzyme maturation permease subunit
VRRRFRWWIMVQQELRVIARSRLFLALVILECLHVFFRLLQIFTYDTLNSSPASPLTQAFRQIALLSVNSTTFLDFIRLQTGLVFLATILAGAGMICNDYKNNLMEIYFSKPLTWRDYVLGKFTALILVGLGFTAFPGLLLLAAHNVLSASLATLQDTYWLAYAIAGFSLVLVVPCALGVLACSALTSSQRYASIAVFMTLFGDLVIGRLLPELLHNRDYNIVAFPLAINRIGESLFRERHPLFELSWTWSALFVGVVCAGALAIVCRAVRRAEIAA